MNSFKIFKFITAMLVVLIVGWYSYGLYLFLNLPQPNITDKQMSVRKIQDSSNKLTDNLDVATLQALITPEKRLFHNGKSYSNLFYPLTAGGVTFFVKNFDKEYSLCFDSFGYLIPLSTSPIETMDTPGSLLGFQYIIKSDTGEYPSVTGQNKYTAVITQDKFPFKMKLVKGSTCNGEMVSEYEISLNKKDSTDGSRGTPVRDFLVSITKK